VKWRNSTNVLAFTNREMQGLVERANQSLTLIDSKRKQLDELTSTVKDFIEKNRNLPKQIEQVRASKMFFVVLVPLLN
jgi:hypothetical protein